MYLKAERVKNSGQGWFNRKFIFQHRNCHQETKVNETEQVSSNFYFDIQCISKTFSNINVKYNFRRGRFKFEARTRTGQGRNNTS